MKITRILRVIKVLTVYHLLIFAFRVSIYLQFFSFELKDFLFSFNPAEGYKLVLCKNANISLERVDLVLGQIRYSEIERNLLRMRFRTQGAVTM